MKKSQSSQAHFNHSPIALKSNYQIAIVVSDYYQEISAKLFAGVQFIFKQYPMITTQSFKVSGSFELPIVCQRVLKNNNFDGAIALGVVVQGETRHFDFVCHGVTDGLMRVMLDSNKVIGFGVLTVENLNQAHQRAEEITETKANHQLSNKGIETANSLIRALGAMEAIKP